MLLRRIFHTDLVLIYKIIKPLSYSILEFNYVLFELVISILSVLVRAVKSCGLSRYRVNPLSTQPNRVPTQPNPKSSGSYRVSTQRVRACYCVPKKSLTLC